MAQAGQYPWQFNQGPVIVNSSGNAAINASVPDGSRTAIANPPATAVANQTTEKPGFFARLFGACSFS